MRHIQFFGKGWYRPIMVCCLLWFLCGIAAAKDFTVTLDAGHGGKDYGAIGVKTNEKTVTLAVVKELGKLIEKNLADVKVVYTRDKDEFISLDERAAIANKANSDLFISVHINSVSKRNRNRKKIEGCQVYTLGLHKTAENLAVAKRENAVMELEADHTEKYAGFDPNSLESDIIFELSQNKRLDQSIEFADAVYRELVTVAGRAPKGVRQAGFWVLWATSMPSVLVELDFICNPDVEKYLDSDKGQEEMVVALYNAFCAYLNTYGAQVTGRNIPVAQALTLNRPEYAERRKQLEAQMVQDEETIENATNEVESNGIEQVLGEVGKEEYYVQILASSDELKKGSSEFKGMKDVMYYKEGGLFKYVVGVSTTLGDAKCMYRKVKQTFPKCFIVKMKDGKRIGFIKP